MKYTNVKFIGSSKEYTFRHFEDEIAIGDTVVVDTINGLQIAKVCGFPEEPRYKEPIKEVVSIVDTTPFLKRKEVRDRMKTIKKKMKKRVKEIQERTTLETLAEKDEELRLLLDELKSLE